MILETTTLLDGLEFPEGPRWHNGKLWFSDMDSHHVMTTDLDGNAEIITTVPGQPSGLGWLPDGRLLVVSMTDCRLLRLDPVGLVEVADLSEIASYQCNDMVVDKQGRAYIGSVGHTQSSDPSATPELAEIVMVTPDGDACVVADKLACPNGIAISPDGHTLVVAESYGARLAAFNIEPDGSLTNRRIWAQFDDRGYETLQDYDRTVPDGICFDAEGAIWVACLCGSDKVVRVLDGGKITHRVQVENQPLAVMLGGLDRQTLFVCTSIYGDRPPGIGRIETVQVEVPGAGLP